MVFASCHIDVLKKRIYSFLIIVTQNNNPATVLMKLLMKFLFKTAFVSGMNPSLTALMLIPT